MQFKVLQQRSSDSKEEIQICVSIIDDAGATLSMISDKFTKKSQLTPAQNESQRRLFLCNLMVIVEDNYVRSLKGGPTILVAEELLDAEFVSPNMGK